MNIIIIFITKIIYKFLKLFNKGGSLPGTIALKLNKNILNHIKLPKKIIMITGTNGKSSVTNYLFHFLYKDYKVLANLRGDNLIEGWTSLILTNCNYKLELNYDILILEADEHYLAKYLHVINPSDIIITNLFRDQLDRCFEMDIIASKFLESLKNFKGNVFLNGNDPLMSLFINNNNNVIYYGIDDEKRRIYTSNDVIDAKFCSKCKETLKYEYYYYSHIGSYYCENCNFKTPNINFLMKISDDGIYINDIKLNTNVINLYHLYNILSAASLIFYNKLDNKINEELEKEVVVQGRNEKILSRGKEVYLHLIKNPVGLNEVLKSISNVNDKTILFVLNDNYRDGKDISWIYNVNIDILDKNTTIICGGTRRYELAVFLKYHEFNNIEISETIYSGVNKLYSYNNNLYALSTYTALTTVRKALL